jgi:hypothetical protein
MFDPTSRYYHIETVFFQAPDGRTIAYKRRRFLPRGRDLPLLVEVLTAQDERLDQIAGRTLGDPLHFWRICDANDAMNPLELIKTPGRNLRIPLPQR